MKTASEIRVGEVVEFEAGEPVFVVDIERNFDDGEQDASPLSRKLYGESLVFGCAYEDPAKDPMVARTVYVRRERSPISGVMIVR